MSYAREKFGRARDILKKKKPSLKERLENAAYEVAIVHSDDMGSLKRHLDSLLQDMARKSESETGQLQESLGLMADSRPASGSHLLPMM